MRKFEVTVDNELAQALEFEAKRREVELGNLLLQIVQQRLSDFLPVPPRKWIAREQWEALVRGEECPICAGLALNEYENAHGYTIADLSISRLRLSTNQSVPGYCFLICKKHVREAYDLNQEERQLFFNDLMRAAQAIETVFNPIKMNLEMQGNIVPHLHCHIKPRFYGDPAPGAPIHPDKMPLLLNPGEYDERVKLIREALKLE